ncbi:lytic murein transglycosylase B [Uliginosibacterium sp. H1]|uniref:lytic murein transglycosylase B n=1 Tax=Uliginosibacterium sp. H1 TaxID=3114757 RepID=UPI002E174E8F|nr:lytic murein transglycosylase B [Uliginosibacterium sp. H1]
MPAESTGFPFKRTRAALAAALACSFLQVPAQAAGFPDETLLIAFAQDMAARHGLDAAEVLATLQKAQHNSRVIDLIRPPSDPGVRSWQRYRARFIEPTRIRHGVQFWKDHAATLARAEATYGVPQSIIVSIIGVETIYGRNTGTFRALDALATLSFDYPPRAELFRGELEALFLLAREQGDPVESYRGSFAGALGLPQFLPSSIRKYATDFDGDNHIDLLKSPQDAIGSVARFLQLHGWQQGGPVAARAYLSGDAQPQPFVAAGITPQFDRTTLLGKGIATTSQHDAPAALIDLVTPNQPTEYWLGYQNFYVITRYNRSSFYAMTVYEFAEALQQRMGGQPVVSQSTTTPR